MSVSMASNTFADFAGLSQSHFLTPKIPQSRLSQSFYGARQTVKSFYSLRKNSTQRSAIRAISKRDGPLLCRYDRENGIASLSGAFGKWGRTSTCFGPYALFRSEKSNVEKGQISSTWVGSAAGVLQTSSSTAQNHVGIPKAIGAMPSVLASVMATTIIVRAAYCLLFALGSRKPSESSMLSNGYPMPNSQPAPSGEDNIRIEKAGLGEALREALLRTFVEAVGLATSRPENLLPSSPFLLWAGVVQSTCFGLYGLFRSQKSSIGQAQISSTWVGLAAGILRISSSTGKLLLAFMLASDQNHVAISEAFGATPSVLAAALATTFAIHAANCLLLALGSRKPSESSMLSNGYPMQNSQPALSREDNIQIEKARLEEALRETLISTLGGMVGLAASRLENLLPLLSPFLLFAGVIWSTCLGPYVLFRSENSSVGKAQISSTLLGLAAGVLQISSSTGKLLLAFMLASAQNHVAIPKSIGAMPSVLAAVLATPIIIRAAYCLLFALGSRKPSEPSMLSNGYPMENGQLAPSGEDNIRIEKAGLGEALREAFLSTFVGVVGTSRMENLLPSSLFLLFAGVAQSTCFGLYGLFRSQKFSGKAQISSTWVGLAAGVLRISSSTGKLLLAFMLASDQNHVAISKAFGATPSVLAAALAITFGIHAANCFLFASGSRKPSESSM